MSGKGNRKMTREKKTMSRRVSESGEDLCAVCSEVVTFYAIGKCDHFVCYRCSTRMRSLCDQMYCAICRTELPKVVFVKTVKKFEEIDTHYFLVNRRVKVHFENETIQQAFNDLLEHRCPLCSDRKPFRSFTNLKDHMRKDHNLYYCDLCVRNLKVFTYERRYYDRKKLAEHRRVGDIDDKSHKGHPLCEFCDERFLDNDELVRHLRKEHYFCHFCDADGISNQFYSDFPVLRDHFKEAHYLCEEDECAHAQFTNAFRSDIDYKAHKATEHGKGMRKSQQKLVRAVDIDINLVPRASARRNYDRGGSRHQYQRREEGAGAVIGGADYEEVNQDSQRKGGYQPRTKRQQRHLDWEAEETARAITASLAEKQRTGHVNVVDEALVRPAASTGQTQDEKYSEAPRDFPTLDGRVVDDDRSSDEDVASGKDPGKGVGRDTMAKKVARANMFSVAESDLNNEEFPSLGGMPRSRQMASARPSRNVSAQHWQASIMEDDFPSLGGAPVKQPEAQPLGGVSSKPVRSTSAQQKQMPVVEEDFPALGGGNKPKRPGFTLKQNTWVSNSPTASVPTKTVALKPVQSKPAQQKPPQSKPQSQAKSSSYQDYPTLGSIGGSLTKTKNKKGTSEELLASAPVPSSKTMTSNVRIVKATSDDHPSLSNVASVVNKPLKVNEGDFPTLGSKDKKSVKSNVQWGPKPKQPESEEKQLKQDKQEGQFMVAKLKNKNKKKNKVNVDDFESPQGSDSETATRSTFSKAKPKVDSVVDYEIHSDKAESVPMGSGKTTSAKSKKKKVHETKENKSSVASSTTGPRESNSKSEPQVLDTKVPWPKLTDPSCDDFPSLTALKDQSNLPSKVAELQLDQSNLPSKVAELQLDQSNLPSKVAELQLDDFPALSSNLVPAPGIAPPPPGLTKPGPPGFNFNSASTTTAPKTAPPPGFSALGDLITQVKIEPEHSPEPAPTEIHTGGNGEPPVYVYTPPPDFTARNQKLIAAIQLHVKDDESRFKEFKSCSGQFRTDKMGPYDYYDRCSNIIGKDNFRTILPELLVLLPDISKQQELLKAHNAAMRLSLGKRSQVKSKKTAMWNSGEQSQFVACGVCSQVVLLRDLSTHQKEHNLESDFPSLGSTTTSGSSHGMSAWVRAK